MKTGMKIMMGLLLVGLIGGSVGLATVTNSTVETEAAYTVTKRVWMKNSITSSWDADGAKTYIHYWGGYSGTAWPGTAAFWDSANQLVYFDVTSDTTTYMFVRCSPSGSYWSAKTNNLSYADSIGKYYNLSGPISWDPNTTPGSFVSFTPVTTTIVASLAASIDTAAEACSASAAQTAINTYNGLSTFLNKINLMF